MFIEKIEIAHVLPSQLKNGHRILNVGTVVRIEEWANVVVVKIRSGHINNALDEIQLSKYNLVKIHSIDGRPCIFK